MPNQNMNAFAKRRQHFLRELEDGVAIIPTAPVSVRNHDVEYVFRPDSDFYYLTGFTEPNATAVFVKRGTQTSFILFVPPRDKAMEIWTGRRAGTEGAKRHFGADEAYSIDEFDEKLPKILRGVKTVYYKMGKAKQLDAKIPKWFENLNAQIRAGVTAPSRIVDPSDILHEMRLRKSKDELAMIHQAVAVTSEAHHATMHMAKPGVYEYEMEALLDYVFRSSGGTGTAYPSIVASGPNACVLHYISNNRRMKKGDLLLVDAGSEYGYYASDVTRTYPISGEFTKAQREVYDVVLHCQKKCIAMVKPGVKFHAIHDRAVRLLTQGMVEIGLLKGRVDSLIRSGAYKQFFMHRTGHWMGLDVHDCGKYYKNNKSRRLEAGMIFTIEPGLYIEGGAKGAAKRFHGIGVRIEDDILVTPSGYQNLTKAIVKEPDDVLNAVHC